MLSHYKKIAVALTLAALMVIGMAATRPADDKPKRNLKVLPKNISHEDLDKVMDLLFRSYKVCKDRRVALVISGLMKINNKKRKNTYLRLRAFSRSEFIKFAFNFLSSFVSRLCRVNQGQVPVALL